MSLRFGVCRSFVFAVSLVGSMLMAGCAGQNIGSPAAPLAVAVSGPPSATSATSYQATIAVSGGTAPYSCSLTNGTLPAGLSLSNCVLSGTPTTAGTSLFTITVLDSSTPAHSGTVNVTIVVAPSPLTIGYSGSTTLSATSSYTAHITATGGTTPYACSLSSGSLPAGLTLNSNCTISGTPAVPGYAEFGVTVTDASTPAHTGVASFNLTVGPPPLQLLTTALTDGAIGVQYSTSVATTGGITPVRCNFTSGSVPGLTLGSDCSISGTPTTVGMYSLDVTASDSSSTPETASGIVTLSIVTAPQARVFAGTQPVIGASVQMYAAGTNGSGSAPTALLTTPLATNSLGGFTFPSRNDFTCPTPTSIIYLVASGGKVGLGGVTNPNLLLMATGGPCNTLERTVNLVINESTTVASAYGFAQFMAKGAKIGATSTNLPGITLAASTAQHLVSTGNGATQLVGIPSPTGTTSQAKINLLADILNACLTSPSPTSTTCSSFYSAASVGGIAPTTTLDAIMNLVQNPGINVAPLYALLPATPAYLPVPTAAPADWMLYVNYNGGGMSDPSALSIDSQGRIWVASYLGVASLFTNAGAAVFPYGVPGNSLNSSYGGAVDASDNFVISNEEGGPSNIGTVTVLDKTGQPLANSPYTQGGLDFPIGVAVDTNGNNWYANYGNSSVSVLKADGTPVSGASGYKSSQFVFPVAIAVDTNHNAWMANQSSNTVSKISPDGTSITSYVVGGGPSGVAVDAQNNVWTANYYDDSVGLVGKNGTVISTYPGFKGGGIAHPQGIAVDGNGTVWVTNYRGPSLSELSGASTSSPGTALSPSLGWAPDAQLLEAFGLAIDDSGNIWVTNFGNNTLTEFIGVAAPVKTPLVGVVAKP